MRQSELEKQYIINEHGTFTPLFTSEEVIPIKDENGNVIDYELVGYVQTKTAEEVYQKYLYDKANPPTPEPTAEERLANTETAILTLMEVLQSV